MFRMEKTGIDALGNYFSYYTCEGSIFDAIDNIINSGVEFSKVYMYDDGDVSLKYFGGEYTWEEFLKTYEKVSQDIGEMVFEIANDVGSIIIKVPEEHVFFSRKDGSLDLNDLIQKKTKEV